MNRVTVSGLKDIYFAGETIEGEIIFKGVNGVESRGVYLELYYLITIIVDTGKRRHVITRRIDIYRTQLDKEKKYSIDTVRYGFRIEIPDNAPPSLEYTEDRKGVWFLHVKMDIPLRRDIRLIKKLTIYNSVKPDEAVQRGEKEGQNEFTFLTLDKNMYEFNEPISGSFKIYRLPNNLRKIKVCVYAYLEFVVKELIMERRYSIEYYCKCIEYNPEKIRLGETYTVTNFH